MVENQKHTQKINSIEAEFEASLRNLSKTLYQKNLKIWGWWSAPGFNPQYSLQNTQTHTHTHTHTHTEKTREQSAPNNQNAPIIEYIDNTVKEMSGEEFRMYIVKLICNVKDNVRSKIR